MPEPLNPPTAEMPSPPAPATTALQAAQQRLRGRLRRAAIFMTVLSLSIAGLLTAMDGGHFGIKLVYAVTIGLMCWAMVDGLRLTIAWVADRSRAARGQPASTAGYDIGWRALLPLTALSILVAPPAGLWLADRITGLSSPSLLEFQSGSTRITLAITVLSGIVAMFVLTTLERLSHARATAEAAQRQAAESQLRLLQSQLEPHMLFNTLANLRVLIGLDAVRAQAMLDHLIAYLRATLNASRSDSHPLATEFERLADYLALMAIRMGPRLAVDFTLPEALRQQPVPPLLLQPLVENSIQHGLEPKVEGGRISVRAEQRNGRLVLSVLDTGLGLGAAGAQREGGFGLSQVRERLATLYGRRALLRVEAAAGGTLATVELPVEEEQR